MCVLLFHIQAKAAEGEQQNCSNSVHKLVRRLKIPPFERKSSAQSAGPHLLFLSSWAFTIDKGLNHPHLVFSLTQDIYERKRKFNTRITISDRYLTNLKYWPGTHAHSGRKGLDNYNGETCWFRVCSGMILLAGTIHRNTRGPVGDSCACTLRRRSLDWLHMSACSKTREAIKFLIEIKESSFFFEINNGQVQIGITYIEQKNTRETRNIVVTFNDVSGQLLGVGGEFHSRNIPKKNRIKGKCSPHV